MCEGREGLIRSCGAFIRQKVPHESFLQEFGVASIESFKFCRTPRLAYDRAVPIRRVEDALLDSEYVAATRVRICVRQKAAQMRAPAGPGPLRVDVEKK